MRCDGMVFTGSRVFVVHLEFVLLIDGVGSLAAHDDAFVEHELAQRLAQVGVFADPFGDDVPRAFQRFVHGGDAQFRIDEGGCKFGERLRGCCCSHR